MNETNKIKKEEREKPLYIIVQKNLEIIKDLRHAGPANKLRLKDDIQPDIVFWNQDLAIVKYMNESQYSKDKTKLTYIMKCQKT